MVSANPEWQRSVSASFSQLSLQFQAAAQAVSSIPPTSDQTLMSFMHRLDAIEEGQRNLASQFSYLKEEFASLRSQVSIQPAPVPQAPPAANGTADWEAALKAQAEEMKLERERLPARLHNALATRSPSSILMPPMKNKKTPPNAPTTRGEFEHLTKERYEALLTLYDVPFSGDTAAKRETLRAFLGLPTILATK